MKKSLIALALLAASPAMAAEGSFVSLHNTNFTVLIAFVIFVGILLYVRVPKMIAGMLDARAEAIRSELAEARALRDEAAAILANYEQQKRDVQVQADRIVANARDEANAAAAQAKDDLARSIARRLATAEDQIAAAEAGAIRAVREQAVTLAVSAAGEVLAKQMTVDAASASIDAAIATVEAKFH